MVSAVQREDWVEFSVLGPLEVREHGRLVSLGAPRIRTVCGILLVRPGQLVSAEHFVDELWTVDPPAEARALVRGYISRLRRALPSGAERMLTHRPGYRLHVEHDELDLYRFEQLVSDARTARAAAQPERAAELYSEALGLWRGDPFADVPHTPSIAAAVTQLIERRLAAVEEKAGAALDAGWDEQVISELTEFVMGHPLRERPVAQLMTALYRTGRQAEALAQYQRIRLSLSEELGVDPGADLQQLYLSILNADPVLEQPPVQQPRRVVPAALPPNIPDFTGRAEEIALLTTPAVMISTIVGMGGVGKTALATQVAHQVAGDFPDGQLWVNLRGAETVPLDPGDVLARFLRSLGVPNRAIPGDPVERAEMYRSTLAGRKVLIVLDNAASEEQVRPLLPGAATCRVMITSRVRLAGIEGAQPIELDIFPTGEAVRLLARIAGDARVGSEGGAAVDIAELCGGLPLAVRIAGARLAARPAWQLTHLAQMLADQFRRLDQLSAGDLAVRASLALSYRGLDEQPRRLFRLLGLFRTPDFPPWLAALILECPPHEAMEYAETLVDAQLLAVSTADAAGQYRYRFHDLVRLFASECAAAEESEHSRNRALARGLGGWLAIAEQMAAKIPGPCFASISGPAERPSIDDIRRELGDADPGDWFDAERTALLAGVRQACALGLADLAFDLAGCLEKYFDLRGMYPDWVSLNTEVLAVCQANGDQLGEAVMLRGLIDVTTWITDGRERDATAKQHAESFRLLRMFTDLEHRPGMSDAAVMCSWAFSAASSYEQAIEMATRALRLAEESGHLGGEVRADLALALAHFENHNVDVAIKHADSALAKARTLGNDRCEATALQFAGIGHLRLGHFETSRQMLNDSLAISRFYRDSYVEVLTLLTLARLYFHRGDPDARSTVETSLSLSREYNMSFHLAQALALLGEIELAEGEHAVAVSHLTESVTLFRNRGWRSYLADALTSLGKAYSGTDPDAAREAFTEAHALFIRLGNIAQASETEQLASAIPAGIRSPDSP
jgi:DNA-binding SARP family transcriptional activator/tetratricopeptide (TPR) repeat protein